MSLSDLLAAVDHAAGLVYHEIVTVESDVTQWTAAHPQVQPLVAAGTAYLGQLLQASGIPASEFLTGGTALLAALKAMAAADPTVQSGGVRHVAAPAPAEPIAPADAVHAVAEAVGAPA